MADRLALDEAPARAIGARRWPVLVGTFVLALVVRVVLVVWFRPECGPGEAVGTYADRCYLAGGDVLYYRVQASRLADGDWFVNAVGLPGAQHPPAFTVLLAVLDAVGLGSVQAQRVAMGVVGALGAVLIVALVWWIVGERGRGPAVVAGVLAAGYPVLWLNDVTLFSESLLVLGVAATTLAWYRLLERPGAGRAALVGALIGFCVLNRAECLLVALPLAVVILRLRLGWRRRLAVGAAAAVACLAVFAPWVAFNLARFDGAVTFASTPWLTVRFTACDDVFYGPNLGYYSLSCGADLDVNAYREAELDAFARRRALDYVGDNAARWPVQMLAGVGRALEVWHPLENVQLGAYLEARGYAASLAALGWYYAVAAFAVVGGVALRRRGVPLTPLTAWALPVLVAVALGGGVARYRIPLDVAMAVLAALGFWHALHGLPERLRASRVAGGTVDVASTGERDTMTTCAPSSTAAATASD